MNIVLYIVFAFLGGTLTGILFTWLLLRITENDFRKQSKHLS
jgi:hypothetical protein